MRKAQSVLEYTVVIAVFIAAILAMQPYLKRSFQGKLRESGDSIGEQYSPGNATSTTTMTNSSRTTSNTTTLEIESAGPNEDNTLQTTVVWTTEYDTTHRFGTEKLGKFGSKDKVP